MQHAHTMLEGVGGANGCIGTVEQEKLQETMTRCSVMNTQQPFLDEWFRSGLLMKHASKIVNSSISAQSARIGSCTANYCSI
jgi:Flp pilus assembly CpaF family ATPase